MNPKHFLYFLLLTAAIIPGASGVLKAATLTGKADHTPWSGYWWPTTTAKLVFGYHRSKPDPGPLNKYDLYREGQYPGPASSWERSNGYDPNGEPWYGYCDAWASAAVNEIFDFKPSARKGIFFRVGDKKGLLTLAHVDDFKNYLYGESTGGGALTFHNALLKYIGQHKVSIMADLANNNEVWSHPIYQYNMNVNSNSGYDSVECQIFYASDFVDPDFVGTKTLSMIYTYKLYKIGSSYTSSEWTGSSVDNHPEYLWVTTSQASANPAIDIETVRAIAESEDDDVEGNMALLPGHYALLVNPGESDTVGFETVSGTRLSLKFGLDYQNYTDLIKPSYSFVLNGESVGNGTISEEITALDFDVAQNGNATFTISADGDNGYPDMIHFYLDVIFPKNQYLLNAFSNSTWNGIVLNNDNPDANMVIATFLSIEHGMPIYSLPIPNGGARAVFSSLFDHSKAVTDYFHGGEPMILRVSSQAPIPPVYLKGNSDGLFGPAVFPKKSISQSQVVMPEINMTYDFSKSLRLTLYNPGDQDVNVKFDYYSDNGSPSLDYDLSLNANKLERYLDGGFPGNLNINGWAILSVQGEDTIYGDVTVYEKQMIDELPLLTSASSLYLPLLATLSGWQTQITLFNPNEQQNRLTVGLMKSGTQLAAINITLNAHEKKTINIDGSLFSMGRNDINGSWMVINSDYPVAGFLTYQFLEISKASLPLMASDDLASTLRLRYAASDDHLWWTGILLLNPNHAQNDISIYGYNTDGGLIVKKNISMGGENIFLATMESLFDDRHQDIRSVDIHAQSPIAGAGLYATRNMQQFTGIILSP